MALDWDTWGSLAEQLRFELSPEGFYLAQHQARHPSQETDPGKDMGWASIW